MLDERGEGGRSAVRFFANWVVHTRLDRNVTFIATEIERLRATSSTDFDFKSGVKALLGFDRLREELATLTYDSTGFRLFANGNDWHAFQEMLCNLLDSRPIVLAATRTDASGTPQLWKVTFELVPVPEAGEPVYCICLHFRGDGDAVVAVPA